MNIRNVYCIGLGGVGVSAVAKYFLSHSVAVVGSDLVKSPLIDDVVTLGGVYFPTHDPARITKAFDLVVYTDDCGPDHPERQAAVKLGIPTQNFSETLGQIMSTYPVRMAVAGTNGKSTTTALLGLLLADAGQDPTVFVGSRVSQFGGNFRNGRRQIFVAEADEYNDHFLHFHPTVATITNVELDHVNYFHSLDRVIDSFHQFVAELGPLGRLVINNDDPVLAKQFVDYPGVITYGLKQPADLQVANLQRLPGQQRFDLIWRGQSLGSFILHLPGIFNVMNVAAAVTAALSSVPSASTFSKTIERFRGVWRRFEILTTPTAPITVVNDYAHHPTSIQGTLEGAKEFFPGRRLVAVFQPHYHNRLTKLFSDFTTAFGAADRTVIVEVYTVPGRPLEEGDFKTSQDLVAELKARGQTTEYAENSTVAAELVKKISVPGDIVLIIGAGNIWTIAEPLAKFYEQ